MPKGGGFNFFFNKGRNRKKKGWDGVIRGGDKENLQNFFNFFKGKPNIQGMLIRHITNTALLLQEATQKY